MRVAYFSSVSDNTHRLVQSVIAASDGAVQATRLPLRSGDEPVQLQAAYILITPTYGGGDGRGAVPKQVIRFLNDPENRRHLRGVIGTGNRNFGTAYGLAADVIAHKCQVPVLAKVEVFGTPDEIQHIIRILKETL